MGHEYFWRRRAGRRHHKHDKQQIQKPASGQHLGGLWRKWCAPKAALRLTEKLRLSMSVVTARRGVALGEQAFTGVYAVTWWHRCDLTWHCGVTLTVVETVGVGRGVASLLCSAGISNMVSV